MAELALCGRRVALAVAFGFIAAALQGCQLDIPRHTVGYWRQKPSYLAAFGVQLPPGSSQATHLNSCTLPNLAESKRCNGHGRCVSWFKDEPPPVSEANATQLAPLSFCQCDAQWTGPECDIQRKSQFTAFLLSVALGLFGADQFYLGWWGLGALKLCTLGGFGLWWMFDVVRIGSSPVVCAGTFRVAADLAHWAFVLLLLCFVGLLGFGLSLWSVSRHRTRKAHEILLLRSEVPFLPAYGAAAASLRAGPGPGAATPWPGGAAQRLAQ